MIEIRLTIEQNSNSQCKTSKIIDSKSDIIINSINELENQNESIVRYNKLNLKIDTFNQEDNFDLYETIIGKLQIMRVKSENISLTDKYDFFRFLPIKRNNLILVLAIPEYMNEDDFLIFIENFIPKIKYIRFISDIEATSNEKIHKFLRALIYFDSQDSADNFYYEYNTKSFPINKFEFLYSVFVDKIILEHTENILSTSNINKLYIPIIFDPYKEQSEIFCCPLCLERIDTASSGIHTVNNLTNCKRWEVYKNNCKVCSKIKDREIPQITELQNFSPEKISLDLNLNENKLVHEIHISNRKNIKCLKCKEDNIGNWCCMICGFTGCDRYQLGHAVEHFNLTLHRYSIDLVSHRIWDYLGDSWVHRLITLNNPSLGQGHSHNNTIFLENENYGGGENLNTKEFLTRMENIISEYNYVLAVQLEEQRKYYDKEINKLNETHESRNKAKITKLNSLKEEFKKKKNSLDLNKKLYIDCGKKIVQQDKKIAMMKDNINFNLELVSNVKKDLEYNDKVVDDVSNKLNVKLIEKRKKKEELEKELNKLYGKLSNNM